PPPPSTPRLLDSSTPRLTVETGLYLLFVALAAATRFWDLGSRALHHDESLHAYFSWLFATGQGYTHDPLMHGPFLFHANALVYLLFGATDASSRFMPALCGTILVGLPWFLRGPRHLGRWGALAASFALLVSPALLYQGRYIRHDTFTVVGSLLLLIAIVRYVERPERRWLIVAAASLGLLITNHEIVFGIAAIFAGALGIALLWGRLRLTIPLVAGVGVAALVLVAKLPDWTGRSLPTIPWRNPSQTQQTEFYRDLLTNPLPWALLLLAIVAVAGTGLILQRRRLPGREGEGWVASLLGDAPPGSVVHAVTAAWADRTGLGLALAVFGAIFVVFFTSLFTNLYGLATGTVATDGTLLYWLGQHDEQRGEQPWFYYALLFPQYELFAVLFGTAMTAVVGGRALLIGLGRRAPGPRFLFQATTALWFVGIFVALSWAGEKMPWLIIHITLPGTLLAAAAIGGAIERWRGRPAAVFGRPAEPNGVETAAMASGAVGPDGRHPGLAVARPGARSRGWGGLEWWTVIALVALAAGWFLLAGRLTFGEFVPSDLPGGWERVVTPEARRWWWLLAVPPIMALAVVLVAWVRRGPRRAGAALLAATLGLVTLLQVHAGWRLAYLEGDVPRDMLVYTQTAPDMHRMTAELTRLSEEITGGTGLEIWYDDNDGVSWPMQWYLRDFPNRNLFGSSLSAPPDVPVLLVAFKNYRAVQPHMEGYTAQEYVLRWWFPEETIYRNFAIAPELPPHRSAWGVSDNPSDLPAVLRSVGSSLGQLLTPEGQQRLYRLAVYRDLPTRIDSYNYTLYVRDDLVDEFNAIRYG
nr:TIGR03663 family protein [Chloroflexia bacterium]